MSTHTQLPAAPRPALQSSGAVRGRSAQARSGIGNWPDPMRGHIGNWPDPMSGFIGWWPHSMARRS
ncbi:hypothetical protein [Arthrobacter sp. ISL-5]|uniref:hypothetical protein n=1 Tax=Arthrobacter sp. ISL-5 TaxID=2819111 RepID=UPI001BE4EA03|nr:hypothetical protein [Arthrobacter sp. ISL-5]MBT2555024.1 hypothetical protein [Arthrobacter sp. ISL-5]